MKAFRAGGGYMRRATYGILALLIVGGVACGTDDTPALRRGTSGIRRPWGKYLLGLVADVGMNVGLGTAWMAGSRRRRLRTT
jgi:hypothetical protein